MTVALTDLADHLKIASVTWSVQRNDELSGVGDGRIWQAELAPPLWTGDVGIDALNNADAKQIAARVRGLHGARDAFFLYDPASKYPQADPDGMILGPVGVDKVVNGGFTTDSDWTKGAGWSIATGVATKAPGTAADLAQSMTLAEGRSYEITFEVVRRVAGSVTPRFNGGTAVVGTARTAPGTYTETLVAAAGNTSFALRGGSTFDGDIDNVSVKLVPVTVLNPAVGGDRSLIRLQGQPGGYVLTIGDKLAISCSSGPVRWYFGEVAALAGTVTASSTGNTPTAGMRVFPHLPLGVVAGDPVTLIRPAARVIVRPGSFNPGTAGPTQTRGASFSVIQRK